MWFAHFGRRKSAQSYAWNAENSGLTLWHTYPVHQRLASYVEDNHDQIVETWLTGLAVPCTGNDLIDEERESALLEYIRGAVQEIVRRVRLSPRALNGFESHDLHNLLVRTGWCRCDGTALCFCLELREAGAAAFLEILCDAWDATHEFTNVERAEALDLINAALAQLLNPVSLRAYRRDSRQSAL